MSIVKFGDIVKDVKVNVDRSNNPYEFYIAGDHMVTEDLTLRKRGAFATDDVGPAFIRIFKPGQVLYGSRRTYLKKVAVADFEGITANTTFVFETKNENVLCQKLLPFIMLSEEFTKWSVKKSKGSTNPYVLFSDLADYEFELPSIAEQRVLADKLWAAYNLKESYKKMIIATDEMVKAQFVEMLSNESKTIPLSSCVEKTFPGEWGAEDKDGVGVKVIRTTNFNNNGWLDLKDVVTRDIDAIKIEKKQLKKGDILLERSGGTNANPVGRVVYFDVDGTYMFNNFTQLIRCKNNIDSLFVFYFLYNLYWSDKNTIRNMGNKTTGIQNLKMDQYWEIPISNVSEGVQTKFVQIFKQAEKSKQELTKAIEKIDRVIKSLLQ